MQNPPIPFLGPIQGGFPEGRIIRIQGRSSPNSNRININLQTGPNPGADIAIHISVRVSEGYVARNSFENGEWGEEQDKGQLAIGQGQSYEVLILSAAHDYKIAINGQHFAEFPHRIRPHRISHLSIDGDTEITILSFEGGEEVRSNASAQHSVVPEGPPGGYQGVPTGAPPGAPPGGPGYGPPGGNYHQGGYGPPPQQYGGYGGQPQQGYAPGPPPGYQPEQEPSGFENFLGTASSVIAGAISSGMADKLIGSLTSGTGGSNAGNQQQNQQQQQQPQQFQQQPNKPPSPPPLHLPQLGGGGSFGGLGSIGSLLGNLANEVLQPKKTGPGMVPLPQKPMGFNPNPVNATAPAMPPLPTGVSNIGPPVHGHPTNATAMPPLPPGVNNKTNTPHQHGFVPVPVPVPGGNHGTHVPHTGTKPVVYPGGQGMYPGGQGMYPTTQGGYPTPQGVYPSHGTYPGTQTYQTPYPGGPAPPVIVITDKKQKKQMKKAMKYGLPVAGAGLAVGVGAMAMHHKHKKHQKHHSPHGHYGHHRRGSSSSSSSSSSSD